MTSLVRKSAAAAAGAALMTFALSGLTTAISAQEAAPAKAKTTKKAEAKAEAKKGAAAKAVPEEEPDEPKSKSGRQAPPDATHRVPMHFAGLGLTDEQKEALYAVAAKYQPQIQDLEKKADALRDRQTSECESILTAPQKKALAEARKASAERRKEAAERRKAESGSDDEPKAESKKAESTTRKAVTKD
ncbi:Spy/CpxP family protein refolding chaperone [Paludisphaera mucosa]|uniref:Spy/CpxP family protein refolding chaperone n=1 Tax=Paludisphaera mucosa TaxID=3030827 RepID=A0ABT6FBV5_9BACT|nr:Spy/CpxP family protein refolding chaperone [Paludisphaera mucosa]MDG3005031.1 Spy/CpxP family protein refolding chaperone [Paludisphaera mucosa]